MTVRFHFHPFLKSLKEAPPLFTSLLILSCFIRIEAQQLELFRISRDSLRHAENSGNAKVLVVREGDPAQAATIEIAIRDATARAGQDYAAVAGSLQFVAGASEATLEIPLLNDTALEGEETIEILLLARSATGESRVLDSAQLSILDDERPVVVDPTFQPPAGLVDSTSLLEADGKLLVAPVGRRELLRLNPDGSLHSKLVPPVETNSTEVYFVPLAVDALKRILLLRQQINSSGVSRYDLLGLLADGSADPEWAAAVRLGGEGPMVRTALALPDGKWMIGGHFSTVGGVQQTRIARLLPDGSLDTSFASTLRWVNRPGSTASVNSIARQPDGKLIVGGEFNDVNNQTHLNIVRLNEDGSTDATFKGDADASVQTIAIQRDGRILLSGYFQFVSGVPQLLLARLNPDGSIDSRFRPKFDVNLSYALGEGLLVQEDGKIWFSATFSRVNGITRRGLVRLNADGSVDETFDPGEGLKTTALGGLFPGGNSTGNTFGRPLPEDDPSTIGNAPRIWFYGENRLLLLSQTRGSYWRLGGGFISVDGVPNKGLARIFTDGRPRRGVRFVNDSFTARENDGLAKLTIQRLGDSSGTLAVNFSANVTRTNSRSSFTPQRGTVTFSQGETVKELSFPLLDDGALDGEEVVSVNVSSPDPSIIIGPISRAMLIIEDNERTVNQVDSEFARRLNATMAGTVFVAANPSPVVQSDGKILRLWLDPAAPGSSPRLVRLHRDGSLDTSFSAQLRTNDSVHYLTISADGRIYVGGEIGGRTAVVRLQENGRIDPQFATNRFSAGALRAMAAQPDGKLLVGTQTPSASRPAFVARLNLDGTADATFATNRVVRENSTYADVTILTVLPDGKILAAGPFSHFNGIPRRGLVRLNSDGSVDSTFDAGNIEIDGNLGSISSIAVQADGRLVIGGWFDTVQGVRRSRIARLKEDGSLDSTFDPGQGPLHNNEFLYPGAQNYPSTPPDLGAVVTIAIAPDGRIWVGGYFTHFDVSRRPGLARLNPDGTVDPGLALEVGPVSFDQGFDNLRQPNRGSILSLTPHPDGSLLVGGYFQEIEFAPAPLGIAKFLPGSPVSNTVEFVPATNIASEAAGNTTLTLRRRGDSSLPASVEVALNGGTASAGADFTLVTTSVNFAPLETEKIINIALRDDGLVEGNETLRVALRNASSGTGMGTLSEIELNVRDNETAASLDLSFAPSDRVNPPQSVALQADGKMIVADANDLLRLNLDGSIDTAFNVVLEPKHRIVNRILAQPDGRILIAGTFTNVNGIAQRTLARLKSDGTFDDTFRPSGFGSAAFPQGLAIQPDGKILVSGSVSIQSEAAIRRHLIRLNADGTLEASFNVGLMLFGEEIRHIAVQPDGKILIAGYFSRIQSTARRGLARLNPDGSLDTAFEPLLTGTEEGVVALLLLSDGKIVIGRQTNFDGLNNRTQVIRLFADGSLDSTFNTGDGPGIAPWFGLELGPVPSQYPGSISTLAAAADGGIWVGGRFAYWDGVLRLGIAKLQPDGRLDHSFDPGVITGEGNWGDYPNISISALLPMGPDRLIAGGLFTRVNGQPRPGLARLFANTSNRTFVAVEEGQTSIAELDGTVPLWLHRSGDTSRELVLNYAFQSGTATAGEDFTGSSGTVRFAPLETRASVSLMLKDDRTGESDESLRLVLTPVTATADLALQEIANAVIVADERTLSLDVAFLANFRTRSGKPARITSLEVQTDGKLLVIGDFTHVDGLPYEAMARLESDGRLDPTFKTGLSADRNSHSPFALLPDGRIVIVLNSERIGRLKPDGSLDTEFNAPRFGQSPAGFATQPDGKLLVFGEFTTVDGAPQRGLVRLNADGSLDSSFTKRLGISANPAFGIPGLTTASVQRDGWILIGGRFTAITSVPRTSLARLDNTGALDLTFNPNLGTGASVEGAVELPDGRILVHGSFTTVDGRSRPGLARLLPDGLLDETFDPGTGTSGGLIRSLVVQADGKIILSGSFNSFNGVSRRGLVRLKLDGSVDSAFDPGYGAIVGGETIAEAFVKLQPNGQLLVAGSFIQFNGQPSGGLVRLHNDFVLQFLSLDFLETGAIRFMHTARSGQRYVLEASENLQQWLPLSTNVATGPVAVMSDPDAAMFPHRFYRAVSR